MSSEEQLRQKRVQQKIKLMMKNKKLQKINTQTELASEKAISISNERLYQKQNQQNIKTLKNIVLQNHLNQEDTFQAYSNKRMKSTTGVEDFHQHESIGLKVSEKRFNKSNKVTLFSNEAIKKTPSAQKLQSIQNPNRQSKGKLKRPSSVINKSTRTTTSRTRRQKPQQLQNEKQIQQKIRGFILKSFDYGIKLQKFSQQKHLDLESQKSKLFSEELNIIRLMANCKKYYNSKIQNEEEQQNRLSSGVERQIIQMLKRNIQKVQIHLKCDAISINISRLIEGRLSALRQTKVTDL